MHLFNFYALSLSYTSILLNSEQSVKFTEWTTSIYRLFCQISFLRRFFSSFSFFVLNKWHVKPLASKFAILWIKTKRVKGTSPMLKVTLVLTTMFINVNASLPKTSYIKVIDVWLLFNLLLPFAEVLLHTYKVLKIEDCVYNLHSTTLFLFSVIPSSPPVTPWEWCGGIWFWLCESRWFLQDYLREDDDEREINHHGNKGSTY